MTTAAICVTRELSWWPSYSRGEQYDSDLGLYYLRARYYNPNTGRFLSRDPLDGNAIDPASLHKYLYADGDPVNGLDSTGKADLYEWAVAAAITYVVLHPVHLFVHCHGLGRAGTVIGLFGPLLGDGIAAAFVYAYAALQGFSCWTS
jgi:RHS repeat-associated protein